MTRPAQNVETSRPSGKSRKDGVFLRGIIPYFVLVLFVFAVYSNVYGNLFLLDDEFLIIRNSFLRNFGSLWDLLTSSSTAGSGGRDSFYRPMQGLLYFIVYQLGEETLFGFHFLNVSLHAANACLMFSLGKALGFNKKASFAASLLWAAHPIHTEAVTYISATADPLYSFFCLSGARIMLPSLSWKRMLAAAAAFALGLFSKETAIVFPALAMLCVFAVTENKFDARVYLKTWILWLVAALYLFFRVALLDLGDFQFYKEPNIYSEDMFVRFFTFLATLPSYARVFLWPDDLHMQRNFPVFTNFFSVQVSFGAALMMAGALFPFVLRGKARAAAFFGFAWFFIAHSLHSGIAMAVNSLFLEHWLYLPTTGLMLGAADATSELLKKTRFVKNVATAIIMGLVAVSGVLTYNQNAVWKDPITFYENILGYGEKSASAHNNLAMAYSDKGEIEKAIIHYRKAIELYDVFPQTHHNLALALLALPNGESNIDEAEKELERAIRINPDFFHSYGKLAEIYEKIGDAEKARTYREREQAILKKLFSP